MADYKYIAICPGLASDLDLLGDSNSWIFKLKWDATRF